MAERQRPTSPERARYARLVCAAAGVRSGCDLRRAFAVVPRERFLGPGPWRVLDGPGSYRTTPDDDPRQVFVDVPVAIDPARLLNNGQPSIVARLIAALELRSGEHVVHVGCGTGYYTAILAELVGSAGRVTAIEYDPELAERARSNLGDRPNVAVVNADGNAHDAGPADSILVNAGTTAVRRLWLDRLREGGRLVVPLTGPHAWGHVLAVARRGGAFAARFLDPTGIVIFPCLGGRDDADAEQLAAALASGGADEVRRLRLDGHLPSASCWLHRDDYCVSR